MEHIFLQLGLLCHIIGITMMAGSTLIGFFIFRQFQKQIAQDAEKATSVMRVLGGIAPVPAIGGILIILSGITMLIALHGIVADQNWFRIKMGIVLLVILNGALIAGPTGKKLGMALAKGGSQPELFQTTAALRSRMQTFYLSQSLLILTIFTLSTFRF